MIYRYFATTFFGLFLSCQCLNLASADDCILDTTGKGEADAGSAADTDLGAQSNNDDTAVACGDVSAADAVFATAIGAYAKALAADSVAVGANSIADAAATVSFGRADDETTERDEALRRRLTFVADGIDGSDAVNLSQLNAVQFDVDRNTNAIDHLDSSLSNQINAATKYFDVYSESEGARAHYDESIAIGGNAVSSKEYAIALGYNSSVHSESGMALGHGALATAYHSTAIGAGAEARMSFLFALGTQANSYQLPGLPSVLSATRQSGALELVTTDANGNLAADGGATITGLQSQITRNGTYLAGAQTKIDALSSQFSQMELALNDAKGDVRANSTAIKTNTTQIVTNTKAIGAINQRVGTAEKQINRNADAISANRTAIDQNSAGISGNESAISQMQTQFEQLDLNVGALSSHLVHAQKKLKAMQPGSRSPMPWPDRAGCNRMSAWRSRQIGGILTGTAQSLFQDRRGSARISRPMRPWGPFLIAAR